MASYCCFRKSRSHFSNYIGPSVVESISFQNMLFLVLRPENDVVVIEGIGGSGKTWAAKYAFKTAKDSNIFGNYIWVSLSMNCSLRRCIMKIAACLSIDIGEELSSPRISAMIREHLARRKFLLVFDNAYFVEENILGLLGILHPREQGLGSKVIVTTRTKRVISALEADIIITPLPLPYHASFDLLRQKIGKDIDLELIDNCYGMPLSIILLAGALCDVPTQEEFNELIREAYVAQGLKVSVFHTMARLVKFGFNRLPSDTARHCFLYCLLFPEDEAIPVEDLILFWTLDGIIVEARDFHEANSIGKKILHVLLDHGLIHLEEDDHVRVHDVIRETVSELGRYNGYLEMTERSFGADTGFEYLGLRHLMNTTKEEPCGNLLSSRTSTLCLRGNRHMRTIPEGLIIDCKGLLKVLDLSFTGIVILPQSISQLTLLRMLLLIGCEHLQKIQHIGSLQMLRVLKASGCGSLKGIECGSFDLMGSLNILDLSRTSIESLPSLAGSMELKQVLLQDCPCLRSEQTTEISAESGDTNFVKFPYGVSKTGAVRNLQQSSNKDLLDWMATLWLPSGLTFELSDKFGMRISQDVNGQGKTYIYATNANFFQSLDDGSPLWLNCFQKFHIVVSPLKYDQAMDSHSRVKKTKFASVHVHSGDFDKFLEINCVHISDGIEGFLGRAELISLKGVTSAEEWNLHAARMKTARELWMQNCHQLENLFLQEEVEVLSRMGKLQNIWISNMENLAYFCEGMEHLTSFSCLMELLLDCCPKLNFIFPSSLRLPNLHSLHIRFCDNLERVFDQSVIAKDALPALQSLQLWELPELTCICGGVLPSLKDLKVRGCAKLKKIPIGVNENSSFIPRIIGETLWWNNLVWDVEGIKDWMLFREPLKPNLITEG